MQLENVENLLLKKQLFEANQQLETFKNEISVLNQQNTMLKQESRQTLQNDNNNSWIVIILISTIILFYLNDLYAFIPELTVNNIKKKFSESA